ncbi:MAG TPA: tetratricopeptide repeat protein [Pirellulales bacterium]|nr:tetratricopeptide repeat protein [Pirellulales bacterium]
MAAGWQSASGQDLSSLIGKHVIVVAEGAQLQNGRQPTANMAAGTMLDVVRVRGEWLWVNRGWIHRRDVVPYDRAIEFFTRQIERQPTAAAYSHRARVQCYQGDFARALADSDRATDLDPTLAAAWCNRGRAHAALAQVDEAIADFDRAIRLDGKLAVAYSHRGRAWTEKGDFEQAIVDCDAAIRLDPQSSVAYYYRGRARHRQGDREQAIADFSRSIRLNPHYVPAYNHRGIVYTEQRKYARAIADYDAAIKLDPRFDLVHIHYNRGNAWLGLGKFERALADYRVVLRRDGEYLPAIEAIAVCYAHHGRLELAAQWRRRALELGGGERELQQELIHRQHSLADRGGSDESLPE